MDTDERGCVGWMRGWETAPILVVPLHLNSEESSREIRVLKRQASRSSLYRTRHGFSAEAVEALAARLRAHVDLLAGIIGPRHMRRPSTMEAAVAYIERQFAEM